MEPTATKRAHAIISPSGFHALMLCPGKPAMEKGLPDNSNEYSDEGTCAHKVAEMCLRTESDAASFIGRYIDIGPAKTYEFTDDMAEPVQDYVDFVRSLPGEKFYEVEVPIGHITGEEGATGTADVVVLHEDEITAVDLKFGRGVRVEAKQNPQGMMYLAGALHEYGALQDFKRGRVIVHQPRLGPPSEWDTSIADLQKWIDGPAKERAFHALNVYRHEKREALGVHLRPHEDACRFCKAKAICPKLAEFVQENVGADFDVLSTAENLGHLDPQVDGVDHATLALRMKATNLIEDWIKAVRAETERRMLAGETVPGFKLVQGRMGNRAWTDPVAVEALLKDTFRLKQEEMYNFKLISPTQAAEHARINKEGKVKKAKADAPPAVIGPRQWPKLAEFIVRAEGGISVAPESDPRPAHVVTPIIDDFDEGCDLV